MWEKIKIFFKNSEVIFMARLQMVLGFVAIALTLVDPSVLAPIIPTNYLPWFLLLNGLATEYLRRRRTVGDNMEPEEPNQA